MSKNNYINILLLSGSGIIAGWLNYIYHPIMLQYLSIEEFWTFGSLVWLFNILWIITLWLVLFLNKQISRNIYNKEKIKFIFIESLKIFWSLWIIIYIIFFLLSWIITDFLKIDDFKIILLVWLSIIFWFLTVSENSILRGLKKFTFIWILWIIWPLIKLIIWSFLVYLWYSIYWAVIWFLIWWVIPLSISFIYLFRYFKTTEKIWNTNQLLKDFYSDKKEIFHFVFTSSLFAILMNIDVILAKNIFDETTAWIYAGISVLWKFLIFLLLSIETVYYWQIMEYKDTKIPFHFIRNPLILIIITSILAIIFNYFLWWFILKFLKEDLANYTSIYILTLIYYSFLSLISFYTKVLTWWGKYYVNYVLWFLTLSLIVLTYTLWVHSLKDFVHSFIIIWWITTIVMSGIFFREYKKIE